MKKDEIIVLLKEQLQLANEQLQQANATVGSLTAQVNELTVSLATLSCSFRSSIISSFFIVQRYEKISRYANVLIYYF